MNITEIGESITNNADNGLNLMVKILSITSNNDIVSPLDQIINIIIYWLIIFSQIYGVSLLIVMLWAINRSIDRYDETGNPAELMKAFIDEIWKYIKLHFIILKTIFNILMMPIRIIVGTIGTLI